MEAEKKNFLPLDYNERYNPGFNLTFKTCQGDTKHGGPCPNAPQENEEFCGIHMHQKEDQEANSDEEEHVKNEESETEEYEKNEESETEEYETESQNEADIGNEDSRTKIKLTETIYILVRPDRDGKPDIDLFIDPNNSSTRADLENFYVNNESLFKVNKNYFLKLRVLQENMYFIPIFNRLGIIVNFPYVLEKNFDKIGDFTFTNGNKCYPKTTAGDRSLHEIINGKKAEQGGWKLIKECKGKIFNQEEKRFVKLEARWITMISGRSIDKYDPDPESIKFLYYYDEKNNCNIKVAPWNEKSSWLPGTFIGSPHPNVGKIGEFYKDPSGNIYVKIDEHVIDHINMKPEDARDYNLREICVSSNDCNRAKKGEYVGVTKTKTNYQGSINFRYANYTKPFGTRDEAACFYDYYALALHGVEVTNNNILTRKEINRVLLGGVDAIPEFFRYKGRRERDLPKGIMLNKGTQVYTVKRKYKTLKIEETFKTLEEAKKKLDWFNNEIQKMIDIENEEIIKLNRSKCKNGYGYISINNTRIGEIQKVKLNEETFVIFGHLSWYFDAHGKPVGMYKGKMKSLHVHTIEHYFGEYNKKLHGTIDHKNIDPLDCTIESLRPATHSLQTQNRNTKNILGFQGISLVKDKFRAAMRTEIKNCGNKIKLKGQNFYILEDALRFYNKMVIERFGLDEKGNPVGKVHIVPNTITYVKDLYDRKMLTEERIKNAVKTELISILAVNPDWMIGILSEPKKIPRNDLAIYREEILKYYLAQKNVKLNIMKG